MNMIRQEHLRVALIGLVLGSTAWAWGQSTTEAPTTQPVVEGSPRLTYSPDVFDFGEIWQGSTAKTEFTVKNTGTAPLRLGVSTTCGCTTATRPQSPLAPGESTSFTVTYDTRRPTTADKRVIITTNAPEQKKISIDVRGKVKPLFDAEQTGRPFTGDRVVFVGCSPESMQTETLRLVRRYPEPVHLKLAPSQKFEHFDVQLKEIEAGNKYELTITTIPPLKTGMNYSNVRLDTGVDIAPVVSYRVYANAQPAVFVAPFKVFVRPENNKPSTHTVRVHYQRERKIKVTNVTADFEPFKWEVKPEQQLGPGAPMGLIDVEITVPPFEKLPETGGNIVLHTSHEIPKYQTFDISVVRTTEPIRDPEKPPLTRREEMPQSEKKVDPARRPDGPKQ